MPAGNYDTDSGSFASVPPAFPYFYAGHGNDIVVGSPSGDEVYGGQSDDILLGGAVVFLGGTGTAGDPFRYSVTPTGTGNDYLEGGTGSDALQYDGDDVLAPSGGASRSEAADDSGQVAFVGGSFGPSTASQRWFLRRPPATTMSTAAPTTTICSAARITTIWSAATARTTSTAKQAKTTWSAAATPTRSSWEKISRSRWRPDRRLRPQGGRHHRRVHD